MMIPEFLSIGYVVRDLVKEGEQPGGSALYSAVTAQKLGLKAAIFTNGEPKFLDLHIPSEIDRYLVRKEITTTFVHEYNSQGHRVSLLKNLAPEIMLEMIPTEWKKSHRVMICPNWSEIGPDAVNLFGAKWIALAPQGWFRNCDEKGCFYFGPSKWSNIPKKVNLIVVSEEDLKSDPSAWQWIKESAEVAVKTKGRQGYVLSYEGKQETYLPPYVAEEFDPTGAGDVFATTLFIALSEGMHPKEASQMASVAASYVVEKKGLFGIPTRKEISDRIAMSRPNYDLNS